MKFKPIHTCIRVFDLEKSVEFYKNAFDFVETSRRDFPEDEFTLVYLAPEKGAFEVELTYNYGHEKYDLGNGYSHLALEVEDLEGQHKKHEEAGFKVTELMGLSDDDIPQYYFIEDPDGYDIEVVRA